MPDDPVMASKQYISAPNDISTFPFICMYAIPIYEADTGEKNVMEKLQMSFSKLMKLMSSVKQKSHIGLKRPTLNHDIVG